MAEHDDMISEGSPVAPEDAAPADEPEQVDPSPLAEPVPLPAYPGEDAFYAGARGPWLDWLRDRYGYEGDAVDFREHDRVALIRLTGSGAPSREQWAELAS